MRRLLGPQPFTAERARPPQVGTSLPLAPCAPPDGAELAGTRDGNELALSLRGGAARTVLLVVERSAAGGCAAHPLAWTAHALAPESDGTSALRLALPAPSLAPGLLLRALLPAADGAPAHWTNTLALDSAR